MADFAVPDTDLARVRSWCQEKVPAGVRDKVRIECEASGRDLTILEFHAPMEPGEEWIGNPVARLRYMKSRGIWRLYWVDSNDRWHQYPEPEWAHDVRDLLAEIDRDPTALFWG